VLSTPWKEAKREEVLNFIAGLNRPIYRLEHKKDAITPSAMFKGGKQVLIAGSEGKGIRLDVEGQSVAIPHSRELESLNVGVAASIVLYELHRTH
jgi:tRNA G18 (ribose-2'-O)-methylase SpoU